MLSKLLLLCFSLLSTAAATKESAEACFTSAELLNDLKPVNMAHDAMIKAYNSTCLMKGLCAFKIEDALLNELNDASSNPADLFKVANTKNLIISATFNFGGEFLYDPTYVEYVRACAETGATVSCIDGTLDLEGEVGGMLAAADGTAGGNYVDIEAYVSGFPMCLPENCEGEDLKEVMVDATRDAILNSPDVQGALTPTTTDLLNEITFDTLCTLGGPPTCELAVMEGTCGDGTLYSDKMFSTSPASITSAGLMTSILAAALAVWSALM